MAYTGIDNDPSQNFSTGNGGSTDWTSYFKDYFNQQNQQQQPQQQQQQSQVGQAGNYPAWPTGGFPSNQQQQPTMGGNTGITGFLGPYGPQLQQNLDRYSASLPRPNGPLNGNLAGNFPGDVSSGLYGGNPSARQGNYPTGQNTQNPAANAGYPHTNNPTDTTPNWLDLLRGQGSHAPGEPAIGSTQATGGAGGQPTISSTDTINGHPVGPTGSGGGGMPTGGVPGQTPMNKTAAQYAAEPQFQQALEANIPHPGWNYGEAGPPGTPDFVRNPDKYGQQGWEQRYQYFAQHPEQAMPDYKPTNAWYQQNDPKAIANLQALASGQAHDPYMTASGAASQLAQWGQQGAGQMEPGNPNNPMGILHKDGMRYDVATGKNLGPDVLPRPTFSSGGGGGGGYAPRSTYSSGGGGSRGLPAPGSKPNTPAEPLHPMAPSGYGQFFDQYGNPQYNNVISNRDDPDYWRAYYYAKTQQPNTVTAPAPDREQQGIHPL